jgi:phosphoglycerate kinase
MYMKKLTTIGDVQGKVVIVRASLNVPIVDGVVTNEYRIYRALPTLRYLHEAGAKIIVIAHVGRDPEETLKPVYDILEKHVPIQWGGPVTSGHFKERLNLMGPGDCLMAENLRQDPREKDNDEAFAAEIAALGDFYVNDAFAVAHREHASVSALATKLPAYAGLNVAEEVAQLQVAMTPEHPSLFLLGGAKFETKMPLVEKYLTEYDHVFVAGALANDIFKARGLEVGQSMVSDVSLTDAPFLHDPKLLTPIDVVVDGPDGVRTTTPEDVRPEEKIFDAGPATVEMLKQHITAAKTVLWNGPFGNYEAGFAEATEETIKALAAAEATSIVGGGDTVAAIEKLGVMDKLTFVSTGGGAMLTYLEHGSTPVLDLLD